MNQHERCSVLFRWPEVVLPGNFRSVGLLGKKKKSFADALQFEQSSGRIVSLDKKAGSLDGFLIFFFFLGHINCKSFISWRASINIHQFDYAPVDLTSFHKLLSSLFFFGRGCSIWSHGGPELYKTKL